MKRDAEIARAARLLPVTEIGGGLGLGPDDLELHGPFKAKVATRVWERVKERRNGRLILVTAITPTPAGEGKTTVSVGLAQALARIGQKGIVCLREPSLGPVFGMKGGAAGGGHSQVVPMEEINLHFTGDFHAITAANNLLAALADNHLHQGNALRLDPRTVTFRRVLDMNDRALRSVVIGLGGKPNGVPRQDEFLITPASEVMAALCLATDLLDLRSRLGRIVVGYTDDGRPVTAGDLQAAGAMAALLRDAMKPNLVQTLEGTPALIHGGPFANIAHGCNSLAATRLALKLADYVVTEAGFGSDLGAEKFLNIKCRAGGLWPDAAVVVATVRALKHHGGAGRDLSAENLEALRAGLPNLKRHVANMAGLFGLPVVVAVNRFPTDTDAEVAEVQRMTESFGARCAVADVYSYGGEGGLELARAVVAAAEGGAPGGAPRFLYPLEMPVREKIEAIATRVYGASAVTFTREAARALRRYEKEGFGQLPVCIAKTQYSFSDDPRLPGAPSDWTLTVREVRPSAGAGFLVVITGDILTMPGLPERPAAEGIDVTADGEITGLF
jgi:formate--tetrahydrofolate ligase